MDKIKAPIEWNELAEDFLDADGNIFRANQIADALNTANAREARLVEALEKIPDAIPTNWLDPLLSGDKAVIHTSDCREIEALLRGTQDRLRASVAETLAEHRGGK